MEPNNIHHTPSSRFRLLAIRPLANCHPDILKNLTPGHVYKFYNSFSFYNDELLVESGAEEINNVKRNNPITPEELYDGQSQDEIPMQISISAVVGKNGAGKSSLIDLLLATIFILSDESRILNPNSRNLPTSIDLAKKKLADRIHEAKSADSKAIDLQSNIREILKEPADAQKAVQMISGFIRTRESEKKQLDEISEQIATESSLLESLIKIRNTVKVEVYYQINDAVFQLKINTDVGQSYLSVTNLSNNSVVFRGEENSNAIASFLHEQFFYTIAINYSHYGLNSKYLGKWINTLFHKNDGYKTPVVINPMRHDGNFDVNDENLFARYRLLSNKLVEYRDKNEVSLTDGKSISKIRFSINQNKIIGELSEVSGRNIIGTPRGANLITKLLNLYYPGFGPYEVITDDSPLNLFVCNYIIRKVDLIAERYEGFSPGFIGEFSTEVTDKEFLDKIKAEKSHITFKINQAINFLKHQQLDKDKIFHISSNADLNEVFFDLSPSQVYNWMGLPSSLDIINHIPPPIFNVDFVLSSDNGEESYFNGLSSGEQQLIHSVQSVIYHLNNLQSVHRNGGHARIKYQYVNIVFDEIELYFHPEYQRTFINAILNALSRIHLGKEHGIRSINIIFLTHSPFILSDITKDSILKLIVEEGKSKPIAETSETFAANIHELLANSFFMEKRLIGEFAHNKIMELINNIKQHRPVNDVLPLIGDSFLKSSIETFRDQDSK